MESNNNDYGKIIRNVGLLLGIPLLIFVGLWLLMDSRATLDKTVYSDIVRYFEQNKVEKYTLDLGNGTLALTLREQYREDFNNDGKIDDKDIIKYTVPAVNLFLSDVRDIVNQSNRDDNPDNDVVSYD